MIKSNSISVSVVTSSIARPELRQCIESVKAQTYQAKHFVYINGPRWHEEGKKILSSFPHVHAFYLPEETGDYGRGPSMADVFGGAPFLTRSDFIFFLDDDNFYEPNHIESLIDLIGSHNLSWAYSLRRFVDRDGKVICDDDWSSLGFWPEIGVETCLVDNSCYAVSRRLAQRVSLAWTALPLVSDRCFLMALKEQGGRYGCTGLSTVNYRIGTGTAQLPRETYLEDAEAMKINMPEGFPWRRPQVFTPSSQ